MTPTQHTPTGDTPTGDTPTTDPHPEDHPTRYNHYVDTLDLRVATKLQLPSVALCGYVWYPTGHHPGKPLCPTCQHQAGMG